MLCIPSNIMNSLFFPYEIYANLVGFHTLVPVIHVYTCTCSDTKQKRHFCSNLAIVTLKIRSLLPKPNQLLLNNNPFSTLKIRSRSHLKIPGCLKRRIQYVHLKKHPRRDKFGSLGATLTLKIRSRLPKAIQPFIVSV